MFRIDSTNKITTVQGDTGVIEFKLTNDTLSEGDIVYFTVKKSYNSPASIVKKVTTFGQDVATIELTSNDTWIDVGVYLYDIQVSFKDGRVDTVILPTTFTVIGGITDADHA